ncbi:LLM class flavin-dependent oxidoreductase [Catenulispora sp. NL8]|uniref:LLM class flavin-dependent oxidoreductase n=1 Tax=Catenulispora pinistramenti TaxID=2705254 RepID=A0ABS5L1D0_9ACTN|nr:LLM class flavin-dependent oxidoreductase [Catenulispora pinistramenti]MBS2552126.1 LLM class flavin-dependent oxidoreductase [Catenulispora pinistramenti]
MSRVHIVLPSAAAAPPPAVLPDRLTDLRPSASDPFLALAKAADLAGLASVVVPYDRQGPEPLVTAAALLRATRHVTVFAGVQPWIATPQYAAKVSASLQRFSGGRFGWYLDGDAESAAFAQTAGDFWRRPDGLPEVLSEHAFPAVVLAGASGTAHLDVAGLEPDAVAAAIDERRDAGFAEFFLTVGHDPGEIYRIGEYVLPVLSQERAPSHAG